MAEEIPAVSGGQQGNIRKPLQFELFGKKLVFDDDFWKFLLPVIEWVLVVAVILTVVIWLFSVPWTKPPSKDEKEMAGTVKAAQNAFEKAQQSHRDALTALEKLREAAIAANSSQSENVALAQAEFEERDTREAESAAATELDERKQDVEVWSRYDDEVLEFNWILELNWQLYVGFRLIVIAGGILIPALLAKKDFGNTLAGTLSVLVAISAGVVTEYNFKAEAARADQALSQLVSERLRFVAQTPPEYWFKGGRCNQCSSSKVGGEGPTGNQEKETPANRSGGSGTPSPGDVGASARASRDVTGSASESHKHKAPVTSSSASNPSGKTTQAPGGNSNCLCPASYAEARSNFAKEITKIYKDASDERILFLRTKDSGTGAPTNASPK